MTKMIRCSAVLAVVISLACAAAFAQSSGSATYIPKCGGCHGVNGIVASEFMRSRGTPSATDPNIMSLSVKQMFNSVKNGTPGMPPFKGRLTDDQIRDAVAYFQELGTRASRPNTQTQTYNQSTPSESNTFAAAYSQSDPRAKAAALESFLQAYPQSVNKKSALNILMNAYRDLKDDEAALSAAKRGLQIDPNDENAIFVAVEIEITECNSTGEAEVCNGAAALGQRGLSLSKPSVYTDDNWRKTIAITYPYYRAAIALARPAAPTSSQIPPVVPPPMPDIAPPPPPTDMPPPTIALGQSRDQVTAAFGQPMRIAKLGVKEIFYYKDMKVTFANGKVSNVE